MKQWLSVEEARGLYVIGEPAHDFDHVMRVTRMAQQIALAEGADVTIVRLAALLHDLPAHPDDGDDRARHHLRSAQQARWLLLDRGAGTELVEAVVHCIEAHRFRDQTVQPQTLEARCLYDADKLDSIGAIGVARAFAYAGAQGSRLWRRRVEEIARDGNVQAGDDYTPVHEYVFKLQRLYATLHTATARTVGARRHAAMVAFFIELDLEMSDVSVCPLTAD